jgi:PAS domain S-box-containing protein
MTPDDILRSTIEVCPFGVVVVEPSGVIVLANSETEKMFGHAPNDLIGKSIDILIPTLQRAQHTETSDGTSSHFPIRHAKKLKLAGRRNDGSKFQVEVGLNPIRIDNRDWALGVIVDISEGTRIEKLQNGFVSTVRHELRTPLTSIAGALGLLTVNPDAALAAPTLRLLRIAQANSQRLLQLVSGILDMDEIESGKVAFALRRIDIQALVELAIEANRGHAKTAGVHIRLDAAPDAGELRGDPDWLFTVVNNLVSNAVKFSPPGGEVAAGIEARGKNIRVSVRDHGPGVPDEFKDRVFEKFAQADISDARPKGGTGLGLSIVKQIVTRLGGEVGFGDAPGGGAVFYVDLPAWDQTAAEPAVA